MKIKRMLSILVVGVMMGSQLAWAGAVLADDASSPSPAASVSPSPSDSPAPSVSPDPSPDPSPSPTPDPTVSPSPSPDATGQPAAAVASPDPSADPAATTGADASKSNQDTRGAGKTGATGCGGVVPNWVFDVASQHWLAADKGSFTCDEATGYYMSPEYVFDTRIGWYEIMPPDAPLPTYMMTAPNVIHTALGDLVVGSKDYEVAKALGLIGGPDSIAVSGSGPESSNQSSTTSSGQSWIDLTNLVNVMNTLQSNAVSGNVAATSNTQVGNAVTGAANVVANLINLLSSAWAWSNGNLAFFMQNILGNQTGDITLSPTQTLTGGGGQLGGSASTSNTGPNSTNVAGVDNLSTLNVNAQNSGNIVNNVGVNAQSGNALASSNTSAGNVGTGDATAEVNIINLINSFISSGNSFFGILNIFGNLNGDVLFPSGFLNGLVGSGSGSGSSSAASVGGTGSGSSNQAAIDNSGQTNINNTVANSVNNNIATTASSGAAIAGSNTTAGNVSSGSADTTQGLFNLSNTSIFGDNAVLVIVNVLGHWVGKIMSVPGGTSESALLTGGAQVSNVSNPGPDSTNQAAVSNTSNANINQKSTGTITNNVGVNAQSGDAKATQNTSVGNVTTGNAKAASSVANIFNSILNVKHWFGVLVINVFGDWIGDVNNNTSAGDAPGGSGGGSGASSGGTAGVAATVPRVGLLAIISGPGFSGQQSGSSSNGANVSSSSTSGGQSGADGQVLTASAHQGSNQSGAAAGGGGKNASLLFGLSAVIMLVAGALASVDRKLRKR